MTYKETLFFIGKCLTISLEEKNRLEIQNQLKTTEIDWDSVVKVSTAHYVFPALYCNLKRANFLIYLPEKLVNYMVHITDLNRERNQKIIEQAKDINELLLKNNIIPIFLKGTGNLLEGLYEDIAERMVGDIDFIVSKNNYEKAISQLKETGYKRINKDSFMPDHRHYPRLIHSNKICAIEIHNKLLRHQYSKYFNYNKIEQTRLNKDNLNYLNYQNQIVLLILSFEINDFNYLLNNVSLKNAYDIFLLSKKVSTINLFTSNKKLENLINNYIAINKVLLGNTSSIKSLENKKTKKLLKKRFSKKPRFLAFILKFSIKLRKSTPILLKSFYRREYFKYFFKRLFS